jgi:hypothetical protein
MKDIGIMNHFEPIGNLCTYEKDTAEVSTIATSSFSVFMHLVIQNPAIFLKMCK